MLHLRRLLFVIIPLTSVAQQADKIDSFITSQLKERHVPGFAVAVIKNNQMIRKSFYGMANMEQNRSVHEHSVFEIASMTKQFTCAGILLLEEEGKLRLADKLSNYITGLPVAWDSITLYQLMNHTAGLKDDWDEPTSYFLENHTASKMLLAQQKQQLLFKPGEGHHYSSGPFFLGLVIEKITGKHYSYFLRDRIFSPLQMTCTSVFNDSIVIPNRVAGYWWKNNQFQNGIDIPQEAESRADVGMITCMEDMIKWSLSLKNDKLLSKLSRQKMFTPGTLTNGKYIPYGLGWYIYPYRSKLIYEHGGAFRTGFTSRIMLFPDEDIEMIFLCNLWRSGLSSIAYKVASFYIPDFIIAEKSETGKADPLLTERFQQLFHRLAKGLIGEDELYKQLNISGFDPGEIADFLKGFKSLELIAVKNLKPYPIIIFGKEISEIYFYRSLADKIYTWAFYLTDTRELVSINIED